MSTKIKTGQIIDIETYVDSKDNIVLSAAAANALSKANTAETNANTYTDSEIVIVNSSITSGDSTTLNSATLDATTKANTAETNSKTYTDSELSGFNTTIRSYINSQDSAYEIAMKSWADYNDSIYLATANSNTQFWDSQVLKSAKDYTDTTTGSVAFGGFKYTDGYTDGVITGLTIPTSLNLSTIISTGIAYVLSIRQNIVDTIHLFTASKDTYVELNSNGILIFTETVLGAGDPGQTVDTIRIAKVVTDATSIVSVEDLRFIPKFYETDTEVITAVQPELDLKQNILAEGAFIDGDKTKLDGIELGATADQVWGEIGGLLSNQTDLQNALDAKQSISEKGQPLGYASLDASGFVPSTQLPSYVDDVLEFTNLASFPITGETGKIYIDIATSLTYRWSGTVYVELTDTTAVWGNISGTLSNQIDLQNALNAKQDNLTFDLVPTNASTNPVESNGVFDALALKSSLNTNVSFNNILPTTTALYNLGSTALRWANGWINTFNTSSINTVNGSGNLYVNGHLIPTADTYNVGSTLNKYVNGYISNLFSDGIKFNGSASTFNYYGEGTFSPTLDNVTVTYTVQDGKWTRIGNKVEVYIYLNIATLDTVDTSVIFIGGLPFNTTKPGSVSVEIDTFTSTLLSGTNLSGVNGYSSTSAPTQFGFSNDSKVRYQYSSGIFNTSGIIVIKAQYLI